MSSRRGRLPHIAVPPGLGCLAGCLAAVPLLLVALVPGLIVTVTGLVADRRAEGGEDDE